MTDEYKQVLIKIIKDVFREQELRTICDNNTGSLGGNPYHAIAGTTVNARYSDLVKYLISRGFIDSFLNILCQDSERFCDLVNYLNELFNEYHCHLLISVLQRIEHEREQKIVQIYNEKYCLKNRNIQTIKSFNIVDIIFNLVKSIKTSDNIALHLNDFGEFFLKHLLHIESVKNELTEWMNTNCPEPEVTSESVDNTKSLDYIVNYIFVIVTPHTTVQGKYYITSQVAQFRNNDTLIHAADDQTIITLSKGEQGYLEKEIISVAIREIIDQLRLTPIFFSPTPIIELFLPNELLIKDFSMKIIEENEINQPIGYLYPLTVRSHHRFKHPNSRSQLESKFKKLKQIINDSHDINNLLDSLQRENCYKIIPENDLKLKPDKFYIHYISPGIPLCVWTRCRCTVDEHSSDLGREIFKISTDSYCKIYQIYNNIFNIRRKFYQQYQKNLTVGVLFDHDKIPEEVNQLISPNMARKI
ncbi:hypothetical protein H6F32_13760 [Anabaena sp. FACHB-1237]|uniref:EAD6 domain-containing conflict system protein n=1 Tax=Anabaena sp. FACHB-1237 TaxID=2692769 RepID=UPI00167FE933|nr:EAD6 domain-containing conflict system protein [Anabaena sp. FACHB-1237]MBD2138629.1 hypothetical protein [Anabaena sp. FACHB-1237]